MHPPPSHPPYPHSHEYAHNYPASRTQQLPSISTIIPARSHPSFFPASPPPQTPSLTLQQTSIHSNHQMPGNSHNFPTYLPPQQQSMVEMAPRAAPHPYHYQQMHPAPHHIQQPPPSMPVPSPQRINPSYCYPQQYLHGQQAMSISSSSIQQQHPPHSTLMYSPSMHASSSSIYQQHIPTNHSHTNHSCHQRPTQTQRSQQPLQPRPTLPLRFAGPTRGGTPMNTVEQFVTVTPELNSKSTRKRRRPPYSYSSLIAQAILSSAEKKLTLKEIYKWIMDKYPSMYKPDDTGWQNTIRHNLSLNRCFKRVPRSDTELGPGTNSSKGKGGYWAIDPEHMHSYHDGVFARGGVQRRRPGETTSSTTASSPQSAVVEDDAASDCAQSDSAEQSKSSPAPTNDTYSDGALSPITPESNSPPSPISINGQLGLEKEKKNDTHIDVCSTGENSGQLVFHTGELNVNNIDQIDVWEKKNMKVEVISCGNEDKKKDDSDSSKEAMLIRNLLN
uniref:Forkhead box protein I2 n=1 Tax=Anthurium amnicola TaxID=1678845 RepID=A0A1D1YC67_9ARAE